MQPKDILQSEAGRCLRHLIERVERLEEEKAGVAQDIEEIYKEAKGAGFTPKIMRRIVAIRSKDDNAVKDEEELFEAYKDVLGMT